MSDRGVGESETPDRPTHEFLCSQRQPSHMVTGRIEGASLVEKVVERPVFRPLTTARRLAFNISAASSSDGWSYLEFDSRCPTVAALTDRHQRRAP